MTDWQDELELERCRKANVLELRALNVEERIAARELAWAVQLWAERDFGELALHERQIIVRAWCKWRNAHESLSRYLGIEPLNYNKSWWGRLR